MSSNWSAILTFIASLAIVTPIIKFLFLPSYRIHLKRSSYIEKRDLLEKFYNETYLKRNNKNKFILQADTNILLTNENYSYQTIFNILESNSQYFYKTLDSLKFCNLFVKEKRIGDSYSLVCKFSHNTLKIFFNTVAFIYIIICFYWLIINIISLMYSGSWENNSALNMLVLLCALFTIPASKAKHTLKLAEILPIQFKK